MGRQARTPEIEFDIPCGTDEDILRPYSIPEVNSAKRGAEMQLCIDQDSHIHLAACGSHQRAMEAGGRGVFTVALLEVIRQWGVDKITYGDLIRALPPMSGSAQVRITSLPLLTPILPHCRQSPHCYGVQQSRILFRASAPSHRISFFKVEFKLDTWTL